MGGGVSEELQNLGSGEGDAEGREFRTTLDAIKEDSETPSPVLKLAPLPSGIDKPLPELPQ